MSWNVHRDNDGTHPWAIESPRGTRCFTAKNAHTAGQVAYALASVDTLLARAAADIPIDLDLHEPDPPDRPKLPDSGLYVVPGGHR